MKMQDMKLTDQFAGHLEGMKFEGHENDRPNLQGIKLQNLKMQDMKSIPPSQKYADS